MVEVSIAHDYLTQRGGAERVVLSLVRAFPDATLYTTLYDPDSTFAEFKDVRIVTSGLNRVGWLRRHHRAALPLFAGASDRLHIDADVTIASSSAWAHSFNIVGKRIVYCHSPARFLYLTDEYLGKSAWRSLPGVAANLLKPRLITRDKAAAACADTYFANSSVVAKRIFDLYQRTAEILPAPTTMDPRADQERVPEVEEWAGDGFCLLVSRLLPYKNVDVAIEAMRLLPNQRLVIVGRGPEEARLRALLPPNARMVSNLSDAQVRWLYARAQALIAPSFEDYGLTPVEAAGFGTPAIALRAGGYLDTVIAGQTGEFFDTPTAADLAGAIDRGLTRGFDAAVIKAHAAQFGEDRFVARLRREVDVLTMGAQGGHNG